MARLLPPERDIGVMRAPLRSSLALIGIFLVVLSRSTLLDRIGADPSFAPFALVSAAFVLFILAALYSHSRRAADFYVADRKAAGRFGGLAGASALAGLLAVGLAGGAYDTPSSFLLSAIGPCARLSRSRLRDRAGPPQLRRLYGGRFHRRALRRGAGAACLGGNHVHRLVPALRRANEDRRAARGDAFRPESRRPRSMRSRG